MNFTNTDSVENDWHWYDVWGHVTWHLNDLSDQVTDQVFYQINPIKTKISQEIKK